MCLVRGSIGEVARDRAVTDALAGLASETGESVIRTWTPPRQVAFGRRDTTADGYTHARQIAVKRGYDPVERAVGGSAVAYTGCTVAFAHASSSSLTNSETHGGSDSSQTQTVTSVPTL